MTSSYSSETQLEPVGKRLTVAEIQKIDAYWRACNYLCAGMIYLRDNPLLKEPLRPEHFKNRLLGHWGSDPGQTFVWVHLNRVIRKYDLDMIYISGPGHGAPAAISNCYLEGTYSEVYPDKSQDEAGLLKLFRAFSFPGQLGSHCTPEVPGSIHEGGELGYSVSHAFGAAFDNPGLIVSVVVGDGEAETGLLATSWHSNKFLNPIRDGAVLPILHLNGYKIANPTLLSRITPEELEDLFKGYGWTPHVVEGDDPESMHEHMAATVEDCIERIQSIQREARRTGRPERPRWPMIVLRTPKGWTGPKIRGRPQGGRLLASPPGTSVGRAVQSGTSADRRAVDAELSAGGTLRSTRRIDSRTQGSSAYRRSADERQPSCQWRQAAEAGQASGFSLLRRLHRESGNKRNLSPTETLGKFLRDVMGRNMADFRLFSPDENASNRLQDVYDASFKTWMAGSNRKMPTART